ncbi:MAG: DegT/DnrJ/EryC1/StrS family aminotransferase [Candidatus Thorarchaeota archaeon]
MIKLKRNFPLFDIFWDNKDIEAVSNIIKRGSYWAVGPEIKEFESKLSNYFNVKNSITFNSGTSALHANLLAYGITSGEVIVPSMSFIATANCVLLAGAKPIFADIEEETLGLDPNDVENKISKKTRAIIPMHYGGKVCKNIEILREIADTNNLILIEDNAESFGAKIDNKFAGTIGDSGMLSFCQNKIITTGEGGAVITNNNEIANKLLLIRSHGRVEKEGSDYFSTISEMDYIEVGYNYRMPTICASLGISQLEKIDTIINLRRRVGNYYNENLKDLNEIQILPELEGSETVYQLYSILLHDSEKREELQDYLLENGIYTKVYFYPIHLKTFYKKKFGYKEGSLPITEKISKKILTLPFSLGFTQEDQDYIINRIKDFF